MKTQSKQKIVKERRDYNAWVASETLEDYALRYTPKSFRKWSEFLIANTAIGGISFLALEAIGGTLAINYGFTNSFWAIAVVSLLIFIAGCPICYYAAKYNVDMDLLTRGAGFGYIGSTITSLIYASFTFIFFALEAAIMSQALELYFHIPLALGYLLCSLVIIPIVFFGVTLINHLQLWTQPIWFTLMVIPFIFVLVKEPNALSNWLHFAGRSPSGSTFDPILFGMASTVSLSLIAQIGEQVDYLRFLPEQRPDNHVKWWVAVISAGPGWVILGGAKQLAGAFLASLAISQGVSLVKANEPIQMYLAGYRYVFPDSALVLGVATLFVIISQIKINMTNAYAGSLAWSNFFSRITHSHPGRVVWLVFNVVIALVLMELGVFATLQAVLSLYSNVAIAWVGALVADLIINKPLGISPSYIEFKRAYLYNINPVGFGSMAIASLISICAFVGLFGRLPQAYSAFIAMGLAFVLSPTIAIITKGKYYIARQNVHFHHDYHSLNESITCGICSQAYEPQDMAYCPAYDNSICSLCCSLDARCHDACKKPEDTVQNPILAIFQPIFKNKISPQMLSRIISFLMIFVGTCSLIGVIFALVYQQKVVLSSETNALIHQEILNSFWQLYAILGLLIGICSWWLVLTQESLQLAEEERDKQNLLLQQEIKERLQVEQALRQSETNLKQEVEERTIAQMALEKLTQELEQRVTERTAELSQMLDDLHQAQIKLVQSEKLSSLGMLVAGVAHEVNNPVSFIFGNLQFTGDYVRDLMEHLLLYQQHYPEPVRSIQEHQESIDLDYMLVDLPKVIDSMMVGIQRIRDITVSLRNFARSDTATKVAVDIHEGIDSTLMILGFRFKGKGDRPAINIVKNYGNLSTVGCFPNLMNQVYMNILANAIDALEDNYFMHHLEGAPLDNKSILSMQIEICTEKCGDNIQIRITDNGPGMTPDVLQQLFKPLFTTKPSGKGTGLGLSISREIVEERHQGKLSCISSPGNGTTLVIEIPC